MIRRCVQQDPSIIQGRLLLQSEPYCRASFLIEIAFPKEYPFKCPEITFVDPIYHPLVHKSSKNCGCSCIFRFSALDIYKPSTSLSAIVTTIIETIDSPLTIEHSHNKERLAEYRNDYQTFYKKALEWTHLYGRPRY
ncbi:unnamed protein product [Rotaria sp. Silwood1]|nr:unnamed protein product [Rotaria sp. Silwood1]